MLTRFHIHNLLLRAIITVCFIGQVGFADADEAEVFFERSIRPLLAEHCVTCHGAKKQEGGLRLDSREQVLLGTEAAESLVKPGNASASRLMQVILYSEDDTQMPPKAKLTNQQIGAIKNWIDAGAFWPEQHDFGKAGAVDKDAWRMHWAFQPITNPPMPAVFQDDWHPVDAFVRQTLSDKQVTPSPLGDSRSLVRRLSYAITGLPPKLKDLNTADALTGTEQLSKWLADYTDQLLASPQFGERWGRYWLDISRYADTKGYVFQEDREYPHAWQYREWVIKSLNTDMPYDEFLRRQIAADQLPGSDDPAQLAAMGFFTLGRRFLNNIHDIIDDRIDVLSRGTMALTVTCARCHDHKFDPIPTADYYSLYGVFNSSDEPKNEPSALRLVDRDKPREPVIFVRGSAGNRGERVPRRFLTALSAGQSEPFRNGSGRLELANHIASDTNPLTARVAVNRIWLRLFGQGLVESPSDFGVRTPPPSHPDLLDHLATWFIRNNWSRKSLIRYITLSHTWRQASDPRPDLQTTDPENRLIARMSRRRLDFEAFRDSLLSVAGSLDGTIGGKSVDITSEKSSPRRTIYARIDRQNLPGTFRTFDFASPDSHSSSRFETTVPQQALFQLNSPFVMQQAEHLVSDLQLSPNDPAEKTVGQLYGRILKRKPDPREVTAAKIFLNAASDFVPTGEQNVGWQYGWGEIDAARSKVVVFRPLPTFHKDRWSGSKEMPDKNLGWCMLTRTGGHSGYDLRHCPIRRWIADRDCIVNVRGQIKHSSEQGDGVSAYLISRSGTLTSASVHNSARPIGASDVHLKAGDTLDFAVDCNSNSSYDSFDWRITIEQKSTTGNAIRRWESEKDFSSVPGPERLSPEAQLAQTLLLTNEFLFVD